MAPVIMEEMDSPKLKVKCTYDDCMKHFETEKLMKKHKKDDPEHCYCKRCDVDCIDWEDLTLHKVKAMQPWLEGKMKDSPGEQPDHIECEFCGEDFKSFGGRRKHRDQYHPADQDITCPGCMLHFTRASQLIEHFEENKCPEIRHLDYERSVQQKFIMRLIMKDPEEYMRRLQGPEFSNTEQSTSGFDDERSELETLDGTEGGVGVLDIDDPDQMGGYRPLQPEVELINLRQSKAPTSTTSSNWPRLPGQAERSMTESLRKISVSSSTPSTDMSASAFAASITSRNLKYVFESYPPLSSVGSPGPCSSYAGDDDTASVATMNMSTASKPLARTTGATSQVLFKDAKPSNGNPAYWAKALEEREDSVVGHGSNLFKSRIWDPYAAEYNPKRFYNTLIEKYCCPIPDCDGVYDDAEYLGEHFKIAHLRIQFRCRRCLKLFKKASGLIAHCESAGGICKVKDTNEFNQMLDDYSGGFLTSESVKQPKIVKQTPSNAVVKPGQAANGVMGTKFSAVMPRIPEDASSKAGSWSSRA
ncbi:uncharacterized protein LTR77_007290 [Saxophila tyrrhenica]|uniref:C2H2-type domain-containing protein n=1 Tax=Saxophila tyrrhenica TaxID=1690608 RepID=A0AAV9P4B1_9PEZI|nr:hypothetical protein LTR77_007290 [Saxophila tyrrhenica]